MSWRRFSRRNAASTKAIAFVLATTIGIQAESAFAGIKPKTSKKLQKELVTLVRDNSLASATATIGHNGAIVWQGATGYADVDARVEATAETPYRIASITKSMTAVAVMQQAQHGPLDLDAPIQTYLPTYPKKEWPVTARHLLMHLTGMGHYKGMENRPMKHYATLANALGVFHDRPLAFEPGTKYRYSTYGYTLLGAVLESIAGSSYEEAMRAQVWEPASMSATQLEWSSRPIANQAKLYRRQSKRLVADMQTDLSVKFPGGGVVSTSGDLVRFGMAFLGDTLVSAETRELMLTPPPDHNGPPYALGWIVFNHDELGRVAVNDGNQSGTNSHLVLLRDHRIVAAVLTNVSRQGRVVQPFTFQLLETYLAAE